MSNERYYKSIDRILDAQARKTSGREKTHNFKTTINVLRRTVNEKTYVDIGAGTDKILGVHFTTFRAAVQSLVEDEGYTRHYVEVESESGTAVMKVLAPKGTTSKDVYDNRNKIGKIESSE